VSRRGAGRGASASRPLPRLILLLLAAVAVALSPAHGAKSGSGPSGVFHSAASAVPAAAPAGDEATGSTPAPSRAGLHLSSAASSAVERPAVHAVLPAVFTVGLILALLGARPGMAWRRELRLPRGSARGPPASLA
jgi:hypothetical protein